MKIKRPFILALCGLLLFTGACSQKDAKSEAYAVYTNTTSKLNAAPGGENAQSDIDMEMFMNMKVMGLEIPTTASGNIKSVVEDGKVHYSALMETSTMGTTNTIEMLYDGEKFYYAVDGVETEIDMTAFEEQMQQQVNLPEFNLDAVKSYETVDVAEGKKTALIIDGGKISDFIMESLGDAEMLAGSVENVSTDDMVIEIVVDGDGNPKSVNMQMSISMDTEGQTMEMDMSMKITVNKFGSGVEVDTSKLQAA